MVEKAEGAESRFVAVAVEPFRALWPELDGLTREHALEVEPESPRKFQLDVGRMVEANAAGAVRIWTLRVNGELVGYVSWNLQWDLESAGLPIATQGAWFVSKGVPWGAAAKLFGESLEGLRAIGIQCVFPHHRDRGRGKAIGRFFKGLGAIPIQSTYMLWIGREAPESGSQDA